MLRYASPPSAAIASFSSVLALSAFACATGDVEAGDVESEDVEAPGGDAWSVDVWPTTGMHNASSRMARSWFILISLDAGHAIVAAREIQRRVSESGFTPVSAYSLGAWDRRRPRMRSPVWFLARMCT